MSIHKFEDLRFAEFICGQPNFDNKYMMPCINLALVRKSNHWRQNEHQSWPFLE
jgi:hypothetical protein